MKSNVAVDHFNEVWRQKHLEEAPGAAYSRGLNERVDRAIEAIGSGRRLLDIGCGPGTLGAQVSDRFDAVFGIEIAAPAAAAARALDVHSVIANFGDHGLPFSTASFDVVTALSSIQYAMDPLALLQECQRVLTPQGTLVLSVPNMRTVGKIFRLIIRGEFPGTSQDNVGYDGGTLHYFCFRDVARLLHNAGFKPIERHPLYCRPLILSKVPGTGLIGRLRNEFFSGEMFLLCQKTG